MGGDHGPEPLSVEGIKIMSIFVVLLAGIIGASLPVLFAYCFREKHHERRIQTVLKVMTCLSIGIVLATAMIHMLPEGINSLKESGVSIFQDPKEAHNESEEEGHHEEEGGHGEHEHAYPFGFLFAMCGMALVYFISTEINWYGMRQLKELEGVDCDEDEEERLASVIKLYILEIGVAVHSVIIGVTLGLLTDRKTAVTLCVVLNVHQLFEGLAIGALVTVAQVTFCQAVGFVVTFGLTCPVGIAIGLGIHASGHENKVAQGVFECISAGILLHMALVEMLPHVFGAHQHHAHGPLPLAQMHDQLHGHDHEHGDDDSHGHAHGGGHGHAHGGHGHGHGHAHGTPIIAAGAAGAAAVSAVAPAGPPAGYGSTDDVAPTKMPALTPAEANDDSRTSSRNSNNPLDGKALIRNSAAEPGVAEGNAAALGGGGVDEEAGGSRPVSRGSRPLSRASQDRIRNSVTGKPEDDHEADEDFSFRAVCYFAFTVGCAIQAVLGIWA